MLKLGDLASGKTDLEGRQWRIPSGHIESPARSNGEIMGLKEITKEGCWG